MGGCNILENLGKTDYTRCLDLIRDNILATDLAHHLRIIPEMEAMVKEGLSPSNLEHHRLISCLLMTSADLGDQTKDWVNAKQCAKLVYTEFFTQGDREKAFVPSLQIQFTDHIVLPVYKILKDADSGCDY